MLAAGGVAGVATLAACGGSEEDSSSGASGSAEESTADTGSGGSTEADGGGEAIATVADVPVGGALAATTSAGEAVLLTQPTDGEIHAFSSVCTHQGCTVEPGDGELSCPCHASRFDLTTGDVLGGPATEPLPEVTVSVGDDGSITG